MGLSFGAPSASCGSGSEWMAGFDLQSTFESQFNALNANPEASLPDTHASPETPMPLFGLRSRCGDVRQLRAFGFDVIDAENIGSR